MGLEVTLSLSSVSIKTISGLTTLPLKTSSEQLITACGTERETRLAGASTLTSSTY